MIGAIIGDIVGSRFEFDNHRSKNFKLFAKTCYFTDDTVMTLAVAKALMAATRYGANIGEETVKWMQTLGRKYPNRGYGRAFKEWLQAAKPEPYNSFGNGAAMRVSPAGEAAHDRGGAVRLSASVTKVTHDHPEGLKGAEAVAVAIWLARWRSETKGLRLRRRFTKEELRKRLSEYYDLNFTIDEIRPTYKFNETCQETVPQAIEAFLESTSFEDAIRIAISVGGDSDTLAAITGSIAEAYYGVRDDFKVKALSYLDPYLRDIYYEWEAFVK